MTGIIIPWILRLYLKKHRDKYYKAQNNNRKNTRYKKDDVHISMDDANKSRESDNIGEYVDYEDIPEDNNDKDDK